MFVFCPSEAPLFQWLVYSESTYRAHCTHQWHYGHTYRVALRQPANQNCMHFWHRMQCSVHGKSAKYREARSSGEIRGQWADGNQLWMGKRCFLVRGLLSLLRLSRVHSILLNMNTSLAQNTTLSWMRHRINRRSRHLKSVLTSLVNLHVWRRSTETYFGTIPWRDPTARHLRADRRRCTISWAEHLQTREPVCVWYGVLVAHGEVMSCLSVV